jgi:hypothetical protein
VSSRSVPTIFLIVGWFLLPFIKIELWFSLDWVSMLKYVHYDLSLYVIIIYQLMND